MEEEDTIFVDPDIKSMFEEIIRENVAPNLLSDTIDFENIIKNASEDLLAKLWRAAKGCGSPDAKNIRKFCRKYQLSEGKFSRWTAGKAHNYKISRAVRLFLFEILGLDTESIKALYSDNNMKTHDLSEIVEVIRTNRPMYIVISDTDNEAAAINYLKLLDETNEQLCFISAEVIDLYTYSIIGMGTRKWIYVMKTLTSCKDASDVNISMLAFAIGILDEAYKPHVILISGDGFALEVRERLIKASLECTLITDSKDFLLYIMNIKEVIRYSELGLKVKTFLDEPDGPDLEQRTFAFIENNKDIGISPKALLWKYRKNSKPTVENLGDQELVKKITRYTSTRDFARLYGLNLKEVASYFNNNSYPKKVRESVETHLGLLGVMEHGNNQAP